MKSSRKLDKVLQDAHDDLAILVTRTRQLRRLTHLLRTHLDAQLAPHCYVGQLNPDTLTVLVDSAAWASRLRFETAQLPDKLRPLHPMFARLAQIKVRIVTELGNSAATGVTTTPQRPQLTPENASIINSLADSIEDTALQDALHRLARRAASKP